jgi:Uma2 family endonuclease
MSAVRETTKVYTADDLFLLRESEGKYELVDGQLVERNMGSRASRVATNTSVRLEDYARHHDCLVFASDCGYQIWPEKRNRVRFPDTSLVRKSRLPQQQIPDGHMQVHPDVAVEVVSPHDLAREDVEDKIAEYLEAGIPLLWIIYPKTKTIYTIRHGGAIRRLTESDQLTGEDVLPGFACPVAELFMGL